MVGQVGALLQRWLRRSEALHWKHLADRAENSSIAELRRRLDQAMRLERPVRRLISTAQRRLAQPVSGAKAFDLPQDAEWGWRPDSWCGPVPEIGMAGVGNGYRLGNDVTLFHDCALSEVSLRQIRNLRVSDLSAFGLQLDVLAFDGSFMSLAVELPEDEAKALRMRHLVRIELRIEKERPLDVYVRLNIRHGPNTEQLVTEIPLDESEPVVEFDLGYSEINEKRIEKAWVDIIFDRPEMNQVILRDVILCRRPRAEI